MKLSSIHFFYKTVQLGSFARSARQFGIEEKQIVKAISALEEELGENLFEISSDGLLLTNAGAFLYERFSSAFERLEDTAEHIQLAASLFSQHKSAKEIRINLIGTPPDFLRLAMHFSSAFPEFRLQLLNEPPANSEFDFLLAGEPIDFPALRHELLTHEEIVAAVGIEHPWATRRRICFAELQTQTFFLPKPAPSSFGLFCHSLLAPLDAKITVWTPSFFSAASLAAGSTGITLFPHMFAASFPAKNLHFLRFTAPQPTRAYYILWRNDKMMRASAHRFLDFTRRFYRFEAHKSLQRVK